MLTPYGYVYDSRIIKRIFQDHWEEFLSQYKDRIPEDMQPSVIEAVSKMLRCGTKEMGYAIYMCINCREHPEKIVFFTSCSKACVDNWVDKMSTGFREALFFSHRIPLDFFCGLQYHKIFVPLVILLSERKL